ncbi:histone-lysine N-methyltransferase set-1-like [Saccostrea cucullata]|uniref:histone-lysine N-methyltransferase set-1-like n=1 Tax=Saccostrea cuccullata TaxID=36930 RepID=UPI002ED3F8A8
MKTLRMFGDPQTGQLSVEFLGLLILALLAYFGHLLARYGLFTDKFLDRGTYICEYKGELIDGKAADSRKDFGFLFYFTHKEESKCVDAMKSKGIAKYANDEWVRPNARVVKEIIDDEPYLFLKSIQNLKEGEEIRYDYNDSSAPWRKQVIQQSLFNTYKMTNCLMD